MLVDRAKRGKKQKVETHMRISDHSRRDQNRLIGARDIGIALVPRQIFLVKFGVNAKISLREGIRYEKLSDRFMHDGLGY
jgi:hypothetical protein